MQKRFENIGEFYGAGLFEEPDASLFVRYSRGLRRYLENITLPEYNGETLYPCGKLIKESSIRHNYSYTIEFLYKELCEKDEIAAEAALELFARYNFLPPAEHTIGGNMFTHSMPNFRRIVTEGLDSYQKRVEKIAVDDIRNGLLDVIYGIRNYHTRSLDMIEKNYSGSDLHKALQKVPFSPADTLYEALVCWNFIYYMDGCDNIGRLDADLVDFYKGEDLTDVIRCFFKNVDANDGWSGAIGPDYNPLTLQCIKACKGIRRPSLELRVTENMPQEIWDAAIDSVKAGGGSPNFYNEELYQLSLAKTFPEIPQKDLLRFCGGGCTETMLAGISNVGSLDAGINLALIFEKFMRSELPKASTFEEFYENFIIFSRDEILKVLKAVSRSQKVRSQTRPQPMRTLLTDDCIDKELDFNNGGARYYWSVINIAGIINVIDSLSVIKKIIFTDKKLDGESFIKAMDEGETFLNYPDIPRHGTDSDEANCMAARLTEDICDIFEEERPYLGGKFLPSSIQFTTYSYAGEMVGATPDGRLPHSPLCDSIGAIHNNDTRGTTALLNSAASLCQSKMLGTPVLNVKLDSGKTVNNLKAFVKGYFKNGGMQMQITCVNKEDLLNAQKEPEKYPNLIVRIGGYSEYFSRLSPELQQTVIDRTFLEV